MQLILLSWYPYAPSTTTYHDPAEFWGVLLILIGTIALLLGLTNWPFGPEWKSFKERCLNVSIGIVAIIIGLLLIFG
jgi:hypothetical protein